MKKLLQEWMIACLLMMYLLIVPISAQAEAGTVTLPSAIKIIEEEAFYGVSGIDKVVIPEGTFEIHSLAFVGCSLTEVILPSTLTYIAADAFDVNAKMNVNAPEGSYAYLRCVELGLIEASTDVTTPATHFTYSVLNSTECSITKYTGKAAQVVVPAELDGYAVVRIDKNAFRDCTSITSVILPAGVREIKSCAFWGCTALTQISLPEGLTLIENWTFRNCTALESIRLPDSVTTIEEGAFLSCEKLRFVNFPMNWTKAEQEIFKGCKALTKIIVPEGVTSIPDVAFAHANYLKQIELPDTLVEIGACAFDYCTALESVRLPDTIRKMECYAFRGCESLHAINYPLNWETADNGIFQGCKELASIVIPEGVTKIPAIAFAGADYLASVVFPSTLQEIGQSAFSDCTALMAVELPKGITVIGEYVFSGCTSLTKLELPEGLKTIETRAFYRCTSLASIHLPESVETLEKEAFYECTALNDVNYPISLKSGSYAFKGCSSLTTMVIPEGVTSIPSYVVVSLPSFRTVYIPNSVNQISGSAFYGCSNLTIYGVAGSYAQTFASKTKLKFVAAPLPNATLHISTTGSTAGSIATVKVSATGGTAPYTYRYTLYRDGIRIRQTDYMTASEYHATMDQAGTYQIAVDVKDAIGSVNTVYSETKTVGTAVVTTISGKVLLANGAPVRDVTVFIYSMVDDSNSAFITGTNENGDWAYDEALVGHQYCVKYANDDYVIVPAQDVVVAQKNLSLMATATIMQSAEGPGNISFTMTDGEEVINSVPAGAPVKFNIQAANATRARLIVDGVVYESFGIDHGTAIFERAFTQAGSRSVAFQAGNELGWGTMSPAQTLNVTAGGGQLSAPVFVTAANQQHAFGEAVTISWNPVKNAREYKLYLYCNGALVWQLEDAITGTSYTLDANLIPVTGRYTFSVIATGYGYSQAESGLSFEVIGEAGNLVLVTPANGGNYVIGDTFHITVSNPNGAYVWVKVQTPEGEAILLPNSGAVNATTVIVDYKPTMAGTYTIQAYGFESPDIPATALASSASQVATVMVDGAKLIDVKVGSGYSNIITTEAGSAEAVTNNAVEYIEIYENGVLLATMRTYSEENYIRTFTAALTKPASGLHTYVFKAFDANGITCGTQEVAFYAVTPCTQKTVYSQQHDVRLLKYPVSGSSFYSEPVYVTDALTLLGTYGEYSYVQLGAFKGYIATSLMKDKQTYTIPEVRLNMVTPKNNSLDYLGHTIAIQWDCNIAISDAMKYVVVVTPVENPLYVRRIESHTNQMALYTNLFSTGDYSIQVELASTDGSVVYASSPSVNVHFCRNYEEYLEELKYDPVQYWADRLRTDLADVRTSQKIFTSGITLEDGTFARFELEKLTNDKMQVLFTLATGEYTASADDIKVVQALAVANMIAEQYGTKSEWIELELVKDLLRWIGMPEDFVQECIDLRMDNLDPVDDDVFLIRRKDASGKWFAQWEYEKYQQHMKSAKVLKRFEKAAEWAGYADVIKKVIEKYSLYASIDSEKLQNMADAFYATGDQTLVYVAQYLEMMRTPRGALALSAIMQGVDFAQDATNKVLTKYGWEIAKKLVKNMHLSAFLIGAEFGVKVGQTFNKTFLNLDEIYSTAFAMQYYVDAAETFYPYVSYVGGKFKVDPVKYHQEFYTVVELYGRMVAGCFDASKKFYESFDKAWVEMFWNWVNNSEGNDAAVSNCAEMAQMLRSYFAFDYKQFLTAANIGDMPSLQALMKAQEELQLIQSPKDQYVQIGQTADFSLEASGALLTYQWYVNKGDGLGWIKLKGATQTSYQVNRVTLNQNGCQYRCVITDVYGNEITSDAATLYVEYELPVTGDSGEPMLWLAMTMLAVLGLVYLRRSFITR